mgnify:FL=1|jgi:hypothetical protein
MAEEMDMMGERMPAQDQTSLKAGMPEEARQSLLSSDENIQAVLMARLTEMEPEELRQLDEAITPRVAGVLMKLLPELQELISAVENQSRMENEDEMMPRDMGALGNM